MNRRGLVAVASIAWLLNGCATVFKGAEERVTIDSEPRGARVYLNGNPIGQTPTEVRIASKDTYTFEFRQDGYETRTFMLGHFVGAGWVVLDVLLPFLLINVIVDACTGDWFYLDQTHVMVTLEPRKQDQWQTPAPAWVPVPPGTPPHPPVPGA